MPTAIGTVLASARGAEWVMPSLPVPLPRGKRINLLRMEMVACPTAPAMTLRPKRCVAALKASETWYNFRAGELPVFFGRDRS